MLPVFSFWGGILTSVGGIALLALSAYFYFHPGMIWSWGIGTGIGLILIGALQLFYYFDDKRYRK